MSLICPKCQSKMRSVERGGVTVDVCKQCRGVFLDRGELEQLMVAESRYFGLIPAEQEPAPIVGLRGDPAASPAGLRQGAGGQAAPEEEAQALLPGEFFDRRAVT